MKIIWKSYAILFFFITLGNALNFFQADSPAKLYYAMMLHFYSGYAILYWLNILNIIITIISSLIVLCFAFDIPWAKSVAIGFFFLRIITEALGHHYELKYIQGSFAQGAYSAALTIAALTFPTIPSYIAHFRYAFNKN